MGKRGPKAWEPSAEELAKIRLYAGLGSTQEQIAAMIGKSVPTLTKHEGVRKALDEGRAETIAKVAGSLVKKALNGDTASAIFYLKTQAGWKETTVVDNKSSDGSMSPKPALDVSKLSPATMAEILSATDPG